MVADAGMTFGSVFYAAMVVVYFLMIRKLDRLYFKKKPVSDSDRLFLLSRNRGCSEYDLFFKAAEHWNFSTLKVEEDFRGYLLSGHIPFYVNDYCRKSPLDPRSESSQDILSLRG